MGVIPAAAYRARLVDEHVRELLSVFGAVMLHGPRAAGKTTTAAQHVAQIDRLDDPGTAVAYRADPDAALRRAALPLLIDEWQEVPAVLAAVKRAVDGDPTPGRFLLTGSVRSDLQHETWAGTGRVVRAAMYPLAEREVVGFARGDRASFLERIATSGLEDLRLPAEVPNIDGYLGRALRGGFPDVVYRGLDQRAAGLWLTSYLDDLVTRDAQLLDAGKDPVKLRRFVNVLALNNAGMPTDATLLRAADINARTAAGYEQLLRNLFVLDVVPAWTTNRISRLVRAGKRYLIDPGLAAAAAGLDLRALLHDGDLLARWFDAYAVAQLRPEIIAMQPRPAFHHLRQESGRREVDLIVELGAGRIVGIECKAGTAPDVSDAKHLMWLREQLGPGFAAGIVLHSGSALYELGPQIYAVPLCTLWG